ncbi:hypothetical protein Ae201684_001590 [Aphanomyces euteiches]|uniref:Uncharacterized protein n=1 Tax=Aphanomyces euteiches TaxID=100861 RepID=A0A6G0XTU8_9STRA|nr:hypothetical protein Ae201684_001590 [Aphanomyces euteiches]
MEQLTLMLAFQLWSEVSESAPKICARCMAQQECIWASGVAVGGLDQNTKDFNRSTIDTLKQNVDFLAVVFDSDIVRAKYPVMDVAFSFVA